MVKALALLALLACAGTAHAGVPERITFASADGKTTLTGYLFLPAQRPAATLGFVDALRRTALNTQVTVLDGQTQDPPAIVAVQLDLPAGHTGRLSSDNLRA